MSMQRKIVGSKGENVSRGSVLRVPGKYPYEKYVDFMVFETGVETRPYGLIVTSGYKAGLILINLPKESNSIEGGLSKLWLCSNWKEWVYPDCDIADVYLIDGYEAV